MNKIMNKKTAVSVLIIFVAAAILLGLLLVNKGDGPVMGMIIADKAMENVDAYNDAADTQGAGIYLVVSNAFNKFQEDYQAKIPENNDLYAAIHFVECPKGSEYSGKWIKDGNLIQKDNGTLLTGPEGVISYKLDGDSVVKGSYTFELYDGDKKMFEKTFSVE